MCTQTLQHRKATDEPIKLHAAPEKQVELSFYSLVILKGKKANPAKMMANPTQAFHFELTSVLYFQQRDLYHNNAALKSWPLHIPLLLSILAVSCAR